eukprot:m.95615 g.95615  ORF g.95615 m.95615 type:complete len:210 (-) comp16608_c0_seq3:2674-3303(-)
MVKSHQKISVMAGDFTGALDAYDLFGISIASIGDFDGDNVIDLAVGASGDDDGGESSGAVWIVFLNANGTMKSHQKISAIEGDFTGALDASDYFGTSVANIGDLNGDNVVDIAVGAYYDGDGGYRRGAVWILLLNSDGAVESHQKISDTAGNFTGELEDFDYFGYSVASVGDVNKDGVTDVAVGAIGDGDGGLLKGAVWILPLHADAAA